MSGSDALKKSVDAATSVPQMASLSLAARSSNFVAIPSFLRSPRSASRPVAASSRENSINDSLISHFCPSGALRGEQRLTACRRLAADIATLAQEMKRLGLSGDASRWSLAKRRMSFRDILSFRQARLFFDVRIEFRFQLADDAVIDVIKALLLLQAAARFQRELHLPSEAALVTQVASSRLDV